MSYQVIDEAEVTEPVTLSEVKNYCRIDSDYTADDNELNVMITAARQRLEQFLNIGFARREITLQWDGRYMELPLSPTGDIVSVMNGETEIDADDYYLSGYQAKSLGVKPSGSNGIEWFYNQDFTEVSVFSGGLVGEPCTMFAATYETGYETLPNSLKIALLAQIDYQFKQRGMPDNALYSDMALDLARPYSRNLVL